MKRKLSYQDSLIRVIMVICLLITVLSYILGSMMYRTNTRNTYQNLIYVEMTDFVENIRYGLHFGKSIETYYGMSGLLEDMVEGADDIEGLYVVSQDKDILFATDYTVLTDEILELANGNVVAGDAFYAGMYLTQDAQVWLICRCTGGDLFDRQKEYSRRLLLQSVIGFLVTDAVMLLLWFIFKERAFLFRLLVPIMFVWIMIDSITVGISAYADYSDSIADMNQMIESAVQKDIASVEGQGIPGSSIASLDTYLQRYVEGIREIQDVKMEEDGILIVISRPYLRRVFIDYVLQTVLFLTFSALLLAEYQIFVNYTSEEGKDESGSN